MAAETGQMQAGASCLQRGVDTDVAIEERHEHVTVTEQRRQVERRQAVDAALEQVEDELVVSQYVVEQRQELDLVTYDLAPRRRVAALQALLNLRDVVVFDVREQRLGEVGLIHARPGNAACAAAS